MLLTGRESRCTEAGREDTLTTALGLATVLVLGLAEELLPTGSFAVGVGLALDDFEVVLTDLVDGFAAFVLSSLPTFPRLSMLPRSSGQSVNAEEKFVLF